MGPEATGSAVDAVLSDRGFTGRRPVTVTGFFCGYLRTEYASAARS
jgi:hypothetical protein